MTPSKLFLGFDQRNHADSKLILFLNNLVKTNLFVEDNRVLNQKVAIDATNKVKEYNKRYYDKRHKKPSIYNEGDYVLIRDTSVKPGEDRKLKPIYKDSYLVAKVLNKNRYVIKDIPGFNLTSRSYNSILSPDRLKPWVKPM